MIKINKKSKFVAILLMTALLGTTYSMSNSFAEEILTPRQQIKNGVSPSDVVCKDGYALVIRSSGNSAACVKPKTSSHLLESGWALSIAKTALEMRNYVGNIGDVKIVQIVERLVEEKKQTSIPGLKGYNVVFQACAGPSKIIGPQVLIATDSESKTVRLGDDMNSKTCQTSSTTIAATNKDSIKLMLIKKTDISIIVTNLEAKVNDLKTQLEQSKNDLKKLATDDPKTPGETQTISNLTEKIIDLRNKLNAARAELQRNYYLLHASDPKKLDPNVYDALISQLPTKEPSSGEKQDVPHVNKVSVVRNLADEKRLDLTPRTKSYNFIFQACAGTLDIQFPEVIVKSDSETKSVKMSSSIPASTCLTSSTTIKASDVDSIDGVLITKGDQTVMIKELESKVEDLKAQLDAQKKSLAELTKQSPPPDDFKQKVTELTDKIIDLRDQLNKAREDLTKMQFMMVQ